MRRIYWLIVAVMLGIIGCSSGSGTDTSGNSATEADSNQRADSDNVADSDNMADSATTVADSATAVADSATTVADSATTVADSDTTVADSDTVAGDSDTNLSFSRIEAECAHGPVGDCRQTFTGTENGTQLENNNTTVGYIDAGDHLEYNNVYTGNANLVQFTYAKGNTGGAIEIRVDAIDGDVIGTFSPANTSDWATWQQMTVAITPTAGVHTLFLVGTGTEGILNLDWFAFDACAPQCDGRECGSNSCGGSCGSCADGFSCNNNGSCEEDTVSDWTLIWQDEFDGAGLPDTGKWQIMQWAPGTVNEEVQQYTNNAANLNQVNGILEITALSNNGVTSGRVESHAEWAPSADNTLAYRIETRAMMAGGGGTWPAFWLLGNEQGPYGGWPSCGELDIFEYVGTTGHFQCAAHDDYAINHTMQEYNPTNPETQWHVYGANLYGDRVEFYVDDTIFHTFYRPVAWSETDWPYTNIDGNGMHVILNLAIGGMMGGTVNYNDFPMVQRFDYVRVYQQGQ